MQGGVRECGARVRGADRRAEPSCLTRCPAPLHPSPAAGHRSCNAAAHWPLVPGPRAPDQWEAATQCVCGGSSFPTVRTVSGFRCTLLQLASRWLGRAKDAGSKAVRAVTLPLAPSAVTTPNTPSPPVIIGSIFSSPHQHYLGLSSTLSKQVYQFFFSRNV